MKAMSRLTIRICLLLLITSAESGAQNELVIAATQFPVSGDVARNAGYIKTFIAEAASNGADLIQFSEAALSGYPPKDIPSFSRYEWETLRRHTHEILALARQHDIWVVLGSAHYISDEENPLNCLYVISNEGKIVDRYDKCMLTGGDLKYYTPGDHLVTLELKGYKLGLLICYDSCFPEMYSVYRHRDVKIMLHSFYNAHHSGMTILDEIIPAEIRVRASDNLMWVVASNSSGHYSSWPTCIARPDGSLESLEREMPGILYREFPDKERTADFPSWTHNNKIMKLAPDEVFHNGTPSNHPRAVNTRSAP